MTFYQGLAATLLRVWAATIIITNLSSLVSSGVMLVSQTEPFNADSVRNFLPYLVSSAVYLCLGVAAWVFAVSGGYWIGAAISAPEPEMAFGAAQTVAIGSFLIGVFFVVEYAPQAMMDTVISFARRVRTSDAERLAGASVDLFRLRELAMNWAVVIAALLLAFRARDIGRLFGWLRHAGLRKPEEKQA